MGYRIDPSRPTSIEVRRIVHEELGEAVEALRGPVEAGALPDAEAVHEVRKRIKEVRSLLRLARADLGAAVAREAGGELRRAALDLAAQREADALVETVDRLRTAKGLSADEAASLDRVRAVVAERADAARAGGSLDRSTVLGAARTIEQVDAWLAQVPARAEGWEALAPGFARQYLRGRDAFRSLGRHPSDEALHDWRKRVKDLWYHQRLLRDLWPAAQRPIREAADDLASLLGDDHDLAVLRSLLDDPAGDGEVPLPLASDDRDVVEAVAGRERRRLQRRARELGRRLYVDEPSAWAARHGGWWAAAAR